MFKADYIVIAEINLFLKKMCSSLAGMHVQSH